MTNFWLLEIMLQIKKTGLLSVEHLVDTSMYLYVKYKKIKLNDRYFTTFLFNAGLKRRENNVPLE